MAGFLLRGCLNRGFNIDLMQDFSGLTQSKVFVMGKDKLDLLNREKVSRTKMQEPEGRESN